MGNCARALMGLQVQVCQFAPNLFFSFSLAFKLGSNYRHVWSFASLQAFVHGSTFHSCQPFTFSCLLGHTRFVGIYIASTPHGLTPCLLHENDNVDSSLFYENLSYNISNALSPTCQGVNLEKKN